MPISGILGDTLGWESIFYVFGVIGCIWYIVWLIIIKECPEKDPRCTESERNFILTTLGRDSSKKPPKTPWKSIILSSAVWAITFAHFSENWGYYTMLTQLPTFLNGKFCHMLHHNTHF